MAFADTDGSPLSTNEVIDELWDRIEARATVNMSELYSSTEDVLVAGDPDFPSSVSWSATAPVDADAWGTRWDDPVTLNLQGSNYVIWVPGAGPAGGSWNKLNGNDSLQNGMAAIRTTSKWVALHMQTFGYADACVYINGKKLQLKPFTTGVNGASFLRIDWADKDDREVRFVIPPAIFIQIMHQRGAQVYRAPDRFNMGFTGDSYGENGYQSAASTFQTYNAIRGFEEVSGFVGTQYNQGGTGYGNPGAGGGNSIVGSPQRLGLITSNTDLDGLFCIGSINDGAMTPSALAAAATAYWDAVAAAKGSDFPIFVAGPQPYMRDNGNHTANNVALKAAAEAHPNVAGYINWWGDTLADAWWTGTGSEQAAGPAGDKQTELLGPDGIHPKWLGARYIGRRFAKTVGNMNIRVNDRILERTINR